MSFISSIIFAALFAQNCLAAPVPDAVMKRGHEDKYDYKPVTYKPEKPHPTYYHYDSYDDKYWPHEQKSYWKPEYNDYDYDYDHWEPPKYDYKPGKYDYDDWKPRGGYGWSDYEDYKPDWYEYKPDRYEYKPRRECYEPPKEMPWYPQWYEWVYGRAPPPSQPTIPTFPPLASAFFPPPPPATTPPLPIITARPTSSPALLAPVGTATSSVGNLVEVTGPVPVRV